MDVYNELLDATIAHLETLKRSGTKYVAVSAETLKGLEDAGRATVRLAGRQTGQAGRLSYPIPAAGTAAPKPVVARAPEAPIILSNNQDKAAAIADLRARALVCQKCPSLVSSRKNVVFGVGSIDAQLMFVGEAPGADEDIQGEPFVGRAGQLLTKIIQTMGLERDQVYIANILKCRPDTPGQSYGNRPPTPEEMDRCLPYLHAQIDLIKPKAIVALGATSVDGLFGKVPGIGITKLRGKWREYRGIPVMPTYHPSYLLRPNPQNVKRECWEDMLQVMDRLGMPISERQKGYFLAKPGQQQP
jgi:uracil-DNA glycosylase